MKKKKKLYVPTLRVNSISMYYSYCRLPYCRLHRRRVGNFVFSPCTMPAPPSSIDILLLLLFVRQTLRGQVPLWLYIHHTPAQQRYYIIILYGYPERKSSVRILMLVITRGKKAKYIILYIVYLRARKRDTQSQYNACNRTRTHTHILAYFIFFSLFRF